MDQAVNFYGKHFYLAFFFVPWHIWKWTDAVKVLVTTVYGVLARNSNVVADVMSFVLFFTFYGGCEPEIGIGEKFMK